MLASSPSVDQFAKIQKWHSEKSWKGPFAWAVSDHQAKK